MKVLLLTREYPPDVYGGAGVHVEYLARELAKLAAVEVRTFGHHDVESGSLVVQGHGAAAETTDARESTYPYAPVVRALRVSCQSRCPADGRRRRPLPHLVRRVRRSPGPAHPRHPAGRDRPLDRAAPAVEAGAARPGRRCLGVGRAHCPRGRRRGHRRLDGDAAGSSPPLHDRARTGARHPERRRHRYLPAGARPGAHRAVRDRPGAPLRALRGADLPAEGPPPPDPGHLRPQPRSPGRAVRRGARHARDRPRGRGRRGARSGGAVGSRVDPRDGRPSHGGRALLARGHLLLPVGVRALRPDQPRGDGLRDPRGRDRGRAAFRRSWSTERPAGSFPSTWWSTPASSPPGIRMASRGTWRRPSTPCSRNPRSAGPWASRDASEPRPSSAGRPWPAARWRSIAPSWHTLVAAHER